MVCPNLDVLPFGLAHIDLSPGSSDFTHFCSASEWATVCGTVATVTQVRPVCMHPHPHIVCLLAAARATQPHVIGRVGSIMTLYSI